MEKYKQILVCSVIARAVEKLARNLGCLWWWFDFWYGGRCRGCLSNVEFRHEGLGEKSRTVGAISGTSELIVLSFFITTTAIPLFESGLLATH